MTEWRLPPEALAAVASNLEQSEQWAALLRHFEYSSWFGLVVILVPDRYIANACHGVLKEQLERQGAALLTLPVNSPQELEQLPTSLLTLEHAPARGVVWIEAAIPETLHDYGRWRRAWMRAAAGLNQVRNALRERYRCTLVFVGAPWLQELLREIAPDLWSVRTTVVTVGGEAPSTVEVGAEKWIEATEPGWQDPDRAPDPDFALRQAAQLDGVDGERRALLLTRAGEGFAARGRREEALDAIDEAARIYRQLAAERADAFRPNLAGSLNSLSDRLSELGRREDALAAATEAVDLYRQLAAERPDAFRPYLAMSLNNVAIGLSDLGRREEALAAATEAVDLYRQLAADRPDAFRPDLAMSLNNLSAMLSALGRREEALAAATEAVDLYRQLAADRPDAFRPDLARSLGVLGQTLSGLDRHTDAADRFEEAIRLIGPFFLRVPMAFAALNAGLAQEYIGALEASSRQPDLELLLPIMQVFEKLKSERQEEEE
ncbi:MAG: tetratricopeptide repeat protein [Bryobacteraceae bacterium]|nr:tetratricopeptide repeat protein [Bryobacteraceae bacterium]